MGLVAAVVPLVVLVLVVFEAEQAVQKETGGSLLLEERVDVGVSRAIPVAALVLGLGATVFVWLWSKRAVEPIERIASLTSEVQMSSLDRRLGMEDAPVELARLAASFDGMLERLASSSTLERQLLEDASHELRTPLAALGARIEVARQRTDAAEMHDDLARCEVEVERLQVTLDSLLSSARVRHSAIAQVDNDLAALLARVVQRQRLIDPTVSIELESPQRVVIGIEGASVERAVANLISNAVQHGGGASVRVELVQGPDAVRIVVTDGGPGIDPDRLPHIFDRYEGDRTGIGLAIVKQVAEAYGSVVAESPIVEGRGSRFTLTFRQH